jgi:hypothetical protein
MTPKPPTCSRCGSEGVHVPHGEPPKELRGSAWYAWMAEAAKMTCPHCTPLPVEKWPEWHHGRLVKACACGSATCPVPAYAAKIGAA